MKPDATETSLYQQQEVEKRVPKTGIFNDITIGAMASAVFGFIGYWAGKILGRMGDDSIDKSLWTPHHNKEPAGRGETYGKWVGATSLALIGATVGLRHAREARKQAEGLARQSVELEQANQALASSLGQPVGSLIGSNVPMGPGATVEMAKTEGLLEAPKEIAQSV